jgi:hypothetical protein
MEARKNVSRQEIISLLRGQVACPLIACLAELGIAQEMLKGSFLASNFAIVRDQDLLESCFEYLISLALVQPGLAPGEYELTDMGRTVFRRAGAFLLLFSYRDYFDSLSALLTESGNRKISVDRRRNVLGSGSLHSRKFFPAARKFLASNPPDAFIDVGCGDGAFLEYVLQEWPGIRTAGIDLSPIAIEAMLRRLDVAGSAPEAAIVENGMLVDAWAALLPASISKAASLKISMWFVAHEFSENDPERLVQFFRNIHRYLPQADIVLGEIVKIPPEILARNYESSIVPEFLFFHHLSGQGVLGWCEWKQLLEEIPYYLVSECLIDPVDHVKDDPIPSSFVWHMKPA